MILDASFLPSASDIRMLTFASTVNRLIIDHWPGTLNTCLSTANDTHSSTSSSKAIAQKALYIHGVPVATMMLSRAAVLAVDADVAPKQTVRSRIVKQVLALALGHQRNTHDHAIKLD
jgi:hypothetical protein